MAVRRKKSVAILPSPALVASSARYSGSLARIYRPAEGWQKECYRHFDICGEAAAAAMFYGHALGRATLHIAEKSKEGGWDKVTSGVEYEDLEALFNGKEGQEQMLESIGIHLTIAGACYLVGREVQPDGNTPEERAGEDAPFANANNEIWEIVSVLEMKVEGKNWSIEYAEGTTPIKLTDNDTIIRIWRPHPAKRIEAWSPFRSLLPVLTEIEYETKHIFAELTSRLAGGGILFVPQDITFPPPPPVDGQEQVLDGNDAVRFLTVLGNYMMTPIMNPAAPEALVPIVVMAPPDSIDKVKHLVFWSKLDEHVLNLRDSAIHRFAVGMDLPSEAIEGMSSNSGTGGGTSNGVSHWGAWQIEESTIKMHVEPALQLVCQALTISYIRKLQPGTTKRVRFDTASLRLRPDRSKEALLLYNMGLLSVQRLLEENGFSVTDVPNDEEFKRWLQVKIATGSATPEMVQAANEALGNILKVTPAPRDSGPVPQLPPPPSQRELEERPRTPAETSAAALLAACEGLVISGLMRAGNRMRSGKGAKTVGDCPAYAVHTLATIKGDVDFALTDAFPGAALVLDGLGDTETVVPVLDAYCRNLFATKEPHTREALRRYLEAGVTS